MIVSAYKEYKSERPIQIDHAFLFRHPKNIKIFCWANVMNDGGFHDVHYHPTGWLSGVYYPRLPEIMPPNLNSNDEGCLECGKAYYRLRSEDDPPVHVVKPHEGLMVMFPSYFGHRTIPFKSNQKRISIAFDIILVD